MASKIKVVAANDVVGATLALAEALAGECTVFIAPPEVNGKLPELHGLPESVDDDTALIIESSGSTGTPKRISLSSAALIASAESSAERLGAKGQWLLALPINFVAGAQVLVRSLLADTLPVIMNTAVPFTAEAFARSASLLTAEHRFVSLVPTQLARLASAVGNADHILDEYLLNLLRRFDAILVGGQPPRAADVALLRNLGVNIVTTYGMAETCGGCVYDGTPLNGVELRLGDDSRIQLRGPMLANNLQHAGATTSDGWLQTNDVGQIDDHGKLTVLGRSDRVLISGGMKVALDAVEELTASIGGVVEACAVALDGGEWGERVGVAYVGSPEVADYLAGAIFEQLGIAAKPIRVLRIDRLPRLAASQKPDLKLIKELFERPQA